ncbi:uncharacterized protein LOC113370460 [Ctenocephalides felis]|uniref:uncharacterized protein LOC113370460 n=1 Tax=Ctenocephalides felis TaxID=7515 RepID=UPI000E6E253C|nr:uncharacterized protein LOC113370460 [Ctenocephalides felis]XP_026466913.1 uncharacterized protein LOC113370460 [Ctenocephalides felis]XP_026466914.1 uncharacterized protein LOC113370460 [Ctenocephalides felis]
MLWKEAVIFFEVFLTINNLRTYKCSKITEPESPQLEYLVCRQCGADTADTYYIYDHFSPEAMHVKTNQSIFGRTDVAVQLLENPFGMQFEVVTVAKALCAKTNRDKWHVNYSWYPGFSWKHCLCPRCGTHLGWMFEPLDTATSDRSVPSDQGFYVLILDKVLSEGFINSHMILGRTIFS